MMFYFLNDYKMNVTHIDLIFKITRTWLTDAQIAQLSLADTKQRCENRKKKEKKKIILSEYFLKVTKQTHTRTALQNRDVRSLQSTSTEYKILFYQHDTKVLRNGQMSVCKFFVFLFASIQELCTARKRGALTNEQFCSFRIFRFLAAQPEWETTWQSVLTVIWLILQRMEIGISKNFHCCQTNKLTVAMSIVHCPHGNHHKLQQNWKQESAHKEGENLGNNAPIIEWAIWDTFTASDGLMLNSMEGNLKNMYTIYDQMFGLFILKLCTYLMGKCVGIPWICETGHQIWARLIPYFAEVGARVMIMTLTKMTKMTNMTKMTKMTKMAKMMRVRLRRKRVLIVVRIVTMIMTGSLMAFWHLGGRGDGQTDSSVCFNEHSDELVEMPLCPFEGYNIVHVVCINTLKCFVVQMSLCSS